VRLVPSVGTAGGVLRVTAVLLDGADPLTAEATLPPG
jgi:hypothetical protein